MKTLRAKERLGAFRPESQSYDGEFQIVGFEEMIDFVAAEAAARGRVVGMIPEIKHSTYFASIGLPMEDRFLAVLNTDSQRAIDRTGGVAAALEQLSDQRFLLDW